MKRPSGFDRGGDPREHEGPDLDADPASGSTRGSDRDAADRGAGSPPRDGSGSGASLLGRRLAALRGAGRGGATNAGRSGAGASSAGDAAARESAVGSPGGGSATAAPHEAETVDLSEVREARALRDADAALDARERAAEAAAPETEQGASFFSAADDAVEEPPPAASDAGSEHETVAGAAPTGVRGALARFRAERAEDPVRAAERRLRDAGRARRARFKRERKRFSADSRRRRRNWLIAGGAVAALAAFVAVGVFTPLMAVQEVRVEGASAVNAEEVQGALSRFQGTPLALVEDSAVHAALEPFPMIQRYAVERIPPSTLVVRLEERIPVLAVKEGEGFTLYDAAGVVLAQTPEQPGGVPLGDGALANTESVAFRTASRALRDMPGELRAQIGSVSATSGQDVAFGMTSGVEVIWGDAEESRFKALVLQTTLASLASQEIAVTRIDVSSPGAPVFQ